MDSSFGSPVPGGKLDATQKQQLMEQVKAQIAVANAQELLQVSIASAIYAGQLEWKRYI